MFKFNADKPIWVFNPLSIGKNSIIEFSVGPLAKKGIFYFKKIIEFNLGEKTYSRYLLYSKSENSEYVLEVFPSDNAQNETYLYEMTDTIPFNDEFLQISGQLYLKTPQGFEYKRTIMPNVEERIEGIEGFCKIFDIETEQVQNELNVTMWEYERNDDGRTELLNIEMIKETGISRIFVGEMIEDVFFKILNGN